MAGVSKIEELQARKRALITESELLREALKTEVQNLRGHTFGFFQKIELVRSFGPWLMLAAPMALPLFGRIFRRKSEPARSAPKMKGNLGKIFLAYRLYKKYSPWVKSAAAYLGARRRGSSNPKPRAAHN